MMMVLNQEDIQTGDINLNNISTETLLKHESGPDHLRGIIDRKKKEAQSRALGYSNI